MKSCSLVFLTIYRTCSSNPYRVSVLIEEIYVEFYAKCFEYYLITVGRLQ